jgi:hypothetical protein
VRRRVREPTPVSVDQRFGVRALMAHQPRGPLT